MRLPLALLLLLCACSRAPIEGDEAGECDDGVDNDQDGQTDCDDDQCAAASACANAGDDGPGDTDTEPPDTDVATSPGDTDVSDSDGCPDADADGFPDEACGGEDCDDDNAATHPDAIELCHTAVDEDCDGDPAGVGCEDDRGWAMVRSETLASIPVDAVVQTNWGPRSVSGRDAVCVSVGGNHYLELDHGNAAGAERVAVEVDVYLDPTASDASIRATQTGNSYLRLRMRHSFNTTHLIESNTNLAGENELHSGSGYSDQVWHTVRVELDRTTGEVAANINDSWWHEGTAFLASLGGRTLSLYGWGGDNGSNVVCYSDLSIWTGGTIGSP